MIKLAAFQANGSAYMKLRLSETMNPPRRTVSIERRTLNVQHRTSNECILSAIKKISRSDSIIRHSIFCGSLFCQANHHETVPFWCSLIQAAPLAKKTASLIDKETKFLLWGIDGHEIREIARK